MVVRLLPRRSRDVGVVHVVAEGVLRPGRGRALDKADAGPAASARGEGPKGTWSQQEVLVQVGALGRWADRCTLRVLWCPAREGLDGRVLRQVCMERPRAGATTK